MKYTLLFFVSLLSFIIDAQNSSCDGSRYLTTLFPVNSTLGITFGNSTTINGVNADLKLDFFEPSGDLAQERPLIILAFGGSFIGGTREELHSLCTFYASKGYACATIDYRLYDGPLFPLPDSVTMTDEVLKAVSDMKAAIRFFREDADQGNLYKIDTDLIFVGGISAGAIVASHAAMLDSTDTVQPYVASLIAANGGWTGNSSSNTQYSDEVSGIVNFSGALRSASYIDANDPAIFSVHDELDEVVPYGNGSATIFSFPIISMQGSQVMHAQAQSDGLTTELITIDGSAGHVSYFGSVAGTDSILSHSIDFLFPLVCSSFVNQEELEENLSRLDMYPNPTSKQVTIDYVSDQEFTITVLDVTGRIVKLVEGNGKGGSTEFYVNELNAGTYLVKLVSSDGNLLGSKYLVVE
ncbi:MAG: T9SS type A sorting domain-containing protein [Crocinitomicaceae bacterium]|nr:T9SS type A sorting domain-containing protein [Crocinitomicaceae bacterium]